MTLEKGNYYDVDQLQLAGWTDGMGTGHDGYDCWAYFTNEGIYLGPDEHGIEPIFQGGGQD